MTSLRERRSGRPAYERIYEQMRQEIVSGAYAYGDRLPGKRALAEKHGVSVVTAAHAMELLCDEGYAAMRERSGCYAAYRSENGYAFPAAGGGERREERALSSADVDGFPFSVLARAARRVLSEKGARILEKPPNKGTEELRGALCRYLSRSRGLKAGGSQIVIGAGSEYLYGLIVELLGRDRTWAIEWPSYEKIEQVYRARGIAPERLALDSGGIRSEELRASRASVLHVTPYRSYPSNVTASPSRRAEYLAWAAQGGRFIVEDDFESEFSVQRRPQETLYSRSRGGSVIYINSFSRSISPAMRVGYMVLPEELVPLFEERAGFYSCTVPSLEQYLLARLIDSGDLERHINRVRRKLRAQGAQGKGGRRPRQDGGRNGI